MENNQNNQKTMVNVKTNSIAFFDSKSHMMKLSFYGESMGIVITPPTNVNGKNSWPKENQISVLLTKDRVASLYSILMETFMNKHRDGAKYNCGVFVNKDKTTILDVANIPGEGIVVSIFQNIDNDRIPAKIDSFLFEAVPYTENFNAKTGDFEIKEVHANFFLFVKALEGFVLSINGAITHADRNFNRYGMEKALNYLSQMAAKMGIVEPRYESSASPWNNNSGGGGGFTNNDVMNTIEESNNLADLM